jgi:protein-S-isoprenylcysteine O-methyltransferase Ste14
MERLDALVFRHRNVLAGSPLLIALASTRWEWEADWITWPLSLFLVSAGVALRAWAVCHCGYAQSVRKQLATTGPYSYVRNPLYVGNFLLIFGACVASEVEWLLPIVAVWSFTVYSRSIRHEERRLLAKYGTTFLAYRRQVPSWFPTLRVPVRYVAALRRQLVCVLLLLPFVLKELR